MTAKLIAEEGLLKGLVLSMETGSQWIIGRDPDESQLVVEDPSASRKHLLCRKTSDGDIQIQNLSATNPLHINDKEVLEPRILHQGDTLRIGNTTFRFYSDLQAQVEDLPPPPAGPQNNVENDIPHEAPEAPSHEGEEEAPSEPEEHHLEEHSLVEPPEEDHPTENAEEAAPESTEEAVSPAVEEPLSPAIEEPIPEEPPHTEEEDFDDEPHPSIFEEEDDEAPGEKTVKDIAQINFDLMDSNRWLLKVVAGPNNGAEFSMQTETSYVIGTDPASCDIVFHDVSVSRQHARLTIGKEDELTIEDLKSRNGTVVDGRQLNGKETLLPNTLVSMGTTTFLVFDREGDRHTIISPLLPAIVKVLQQEEEKKQNLEKAGEEKPEVPLTPEQELAEAEKATPIEPPPRTHPNSFNTLVFMLIAMGLFVVVGMGTALLFNTQTIEVPKIDTDQALAQALAAFPEVNYSYNKSTGKLLLVGHVLTNIDKNQLAYNLQGLTFISGIDDNIVVDEYIWQETNQILSKNPNWKGVSMHSPAPKRFVVTGYLQSRKQAEQLNAYLIQNFPYLDLLEKRIIVEEDVLSQINAYLEDNGLTEVIAKMINGEVTLTGNIAFGAKSALDKAVDQIKGIQGVRVLKNFVSELPPDQLIVNISGNYKVTGTSIQKNGKVNVVIGGRILSVGDNLDGMTIQSIEPSTVILEREGIKYRIDYNR